MQLASLKKEFYILAIYKIHFFINFRCKQWVIAIRRKDLDKDDFTKFHKSKVVCSDHFETIMYNNTNDRSSSLRHDAYPTIISAPNPPNSVTPKRNPPKRRCLETPLKNIQMDNQENDIPPHYSPPSGTIEIFSNSPPVKQNNSSPKICKHLCYKKMYLRERQKNAKLYGRINRLQKSLSKKSNRQFDPPLFEEVKPNYNPTLSRFLKSQEEYFSRKLKGMRWTHEDMQLAIILFYKSPAAYKYLRSIFGLPGMTTLYKELSMTMSFSGLCQRTLEGLKIKFDDAPILHKTCSLVLDGMKLQPCLQYLKSNYIAGFEEKAFNQRSPKIATELVVLMLQGSTTNWRQVTIIYFIGN